jgi:homoserine kinase
MTVFKAFVPAKVNLTLHVTGQRDDGYHTLDSLAVFADIGDRLTITLPGSYQLEVTGPMAAGVPVDDSNLVLKAARMMRVNTDIVLEKHLPNAAGLGGGSGDAAATLRVLSGYSGRQIPGQGIELGADVPLCLQSEAAPHDPLAASILHAGIGLDRAVVERAEKLVPRHLERAVIALEIAVMHLVVKRAELQPVLSFTTSPSNPVCVVAAVSVRYCMW